MKNVAYRRLSSLGAAVILLGAATSARAQFNRVFASARNGNDLNTCNSIVTPCLTLQGAVNQVAAGGTVLVLDTGGYGPVTIGKSVAIEAPAGIEAFIHPPSGTAISIDASGTDVIVLRGLILSVGDGRGIDFLRGGALHVERCLIQGFEDGIRAGASGGAPVFADLYVEDTIIRNCHSNGILVWSIAGNVRASVERCYLVGNGFAGVYGFNNSRVAVWETFAAGNSEGVYVWARQFNTSTMAVERCTFADNGYAGAVVDGDFDSPATLRISNSTVTGNLHGLMNLGVSQLRSRVNNTVEGSSIDVVGSIGTISPR